MVYLFDFPSFTIDSAMKPIMSRFHKRCRIQIDPFRIILLTYLFLFDSLLFLACFMWCSNSVTNVVQYAHIWTFYLLLFLFYFEIISYKHHSDNLKTQFSIFFLINCPLLIFSPARIPCVCLSIGNHIILSASHMCATLNLNQESKFLNVQVRGKIEADNVIDWKSTKQKPINTQSHIYV